MIIGIVCFSMTGHAATAVKAPYKHIEFDFKGHEKERAIVITKDRKEFEHQIQTNRELHVTPEVHPTTWKDLKASLGIFTYDLNKDGQNEIFIYQTALENCGTEGCGFNILMQENNRWESIGLGSDKGDGLTTYDDIYISDELTNGFHDLLFRLRWGGYVIWKWNGSYYKSVDYLSEGSFNSFQGRSAPLGYQVTFDYHKYTDERNAIVKNYFDLFQKTITENIELLSRANWNDQNDPFSYPRSIASLKKSIGIDKHDLNGDGKEETLSFLNYFDYCTGIGCPVAVWQKNGVQWKKIIENNGTPILRSDHLYVSPQKTNGYNNLLLPGNPGEIEVWVWNGNVYQFSKTIHVN